MSVQALVLAAALPLVTLLAVNGMGRLWPVDRAVLILVMLLVSIGVITLSAIARSESTPRTQAVYAGIGLAAMFIGAAFVRAWKHWKKFAVPLAALCLLALASPWVLGQWHQGARNWITIVPDPPHAPALGVHEARAGGGAGGGLRQPAAVRQVPAGDRLCGGVLRGPAVRARPRRGGCCTF